MYVCTHLSLVPHSSCYSENSGPAYENVLYCFIGKLAIIFCLSHLPT